MVSLFQVVITHHHTKWQCLTLFAKCSSVECKMEKALLVRSFLFAKNFPYRILKGVRSYIETKRVIHHGILVEKSKLQRYELVPSDLKACFSLLILEAYAFSPPQTRITTFESAVSGSNSRGVYYR